MAQLPRRLVAVWNAVPPSRRIMLAAIGGVAVALAMLLYSWSSSTTYVTLYSGLDPADGGQIVDQLRSRGVPFRLEAGGQTVSVPEHEVDELRVGFASQGLPQGGHVGFEIFNGSAFTATDFVQRLNFQRGLQGELERTIGTFPAVQTARVHVVLPARSLFASQQLPTTASVVLKLRPGRALAPNEVEGVAHLVAGAVEGLEKSGVTIVDTSGRVLYDGRELASQDGIGASSNQLTMQRSYEQTLEHDVQQLLDRALGPGQSGVQVHATLNFDRQEMQTHTFQPGDTGGVARSSSTVTESYAANGAVLGAQPGALANVPGANAAIPTPAATAAAGNGNGTNYTRSETTNNYEVGSTTTKTVQAIGGVKQLSVSLLLDEAVPENVATSLKDSVAAAVGIDAKRGDSIAVTRLPFDRAQQAADQAALASQASQTQLLGYARLALPVVLLLAAFFFFRMLMRSVASRGSYRVLEAQGALAQGGAGVMELGAGRGGGAAALPAPDADSMKSQIEVQVTKLAQNNPETVAGVVQSWLRED